MHVALKQLRQHCWLTDSSAHLSAVIPVQPCLSTHFGRSEPGTCLPCCRSSKGVNSLVCPFLFPEVDDKEVRDDGDDPAFELIHMYTIMPTTATPTAMPTGAADLFFDLPLLPGGRCGFAGLPMFADLPMKRVLLHGACGELRYSCTQQRLPSPGSYMQGVDYRYDCTRKS